MQEYFSSKTVLVTGAAGFIGSHLCDALLSFGAKIIAVDNFLTGRAKNLQHLIDINPNFTFIEADVTKDPETYLPSVKFDLILHFASPASPHHYQAHPVETYLVNSYATHLLLQYLQQHNPQGRFLFAGTSEAYGDPLEHPQKESYWGNVNPNGIRSCYDEAKRLGETMCGVFFRSYGLDTRIVRIFNTYGPRMNPEDGRVVPDFVLQALKGEKLTVHGDGSQTRSYCYVSDLVDGILHMASSETVGGETINLGNDAEFTVAQTAELIYQAVSHKTDAAPIDFKPLPQDDPLRRRPDLSKALRLLGWKPRVSFEEGLQKTIAYFSQYQD